jgi:hypothetical protein
LTQPPKPPSYPPIHFMFPYVTFMFPYGPFWSLTSLNLLFAMRYSLTPLLFRDCFEVCRMRMPTMLDLGSR